MANLRQQQEIQEAEKLFNQNFSAIQKAKLQTGDWEKAYKQVTGRSWPKGQNVEIAGRTGVATKDDPWWKDTLKVAAPLAGVAAAPFTGGLTAALIGAGGGALGGGLKGGLKGALLGGASGAAAGYGADKLFSALKGGGSFIDQGVKGAAGKLAGGGGTQAAGQAAAGAGASMPFKNLAGLMGIQAGLGALGGLIGGGEEGPQQWKSFEGTEVDPTTMLTGVKNMLTDLGGGIRDRASRGVSLRGVGPLPSFSGGGLPMPIGAAGSLEGLSTPGLRLRQQGDEPGAPGLDAYDAFRALGLGV